MDEAQVVIIRLDSLLRARDPDGASRSYFYDRVDLCCALHGGSGSPSASSAGFTPLSRPDDSHERRVLLVRKMWRSRSTVGSASEFTFTGTCAANRRVDHPATRLRIRIVLGESRPNVSMFRISRTLGLAGRHNTKSARGHTTLKFRPFIWWCMK